MEWRRFSSTVGESICAIILLIPNPPGHHLPPRLDALSASPKLELSRFYLLFSCAAATAADDDSNPSQQGSRGWHLQTPSRTSSTWTAWDYCTNLKFSKHEGRELWVYSEVLFLCLSDKRLLGTALALGDLIKKRLLVLEKLLLALDELLVALDEPLLSLEKPLQPLEDRLQVLL